MVNCGLSPALCNRKNCSPLSSEITSEMTGWSNFSTGYFDVTAPALSPYPKKYLPVCSLRIIRIKEIPFHSLNSSRENDRKNFNELDITIAFRFDNTAGNILSPKDSRGRTPTAKGRGEYWGNMSQSNQLELKKIFFLCEKSSSPTKQARSNHELCMKSMERPDLKSF